MKFSFSKFWHQHGRTQKDQLRTYKYSSTAAFCSVATSWSCTCLSGQMWVSVCLSVYNTNTQLSLSVHLLSVSLSVLANILHHSLLVFFISFYFSSSGSFLSCPLQCLISVPSTLLSILSSFSFLLTTSIGCPHTHHRP